MHCERATADLDAAQADLQQATVVLAQLGQICGGALPCIVTAQNAYNQTQTTLTQAQNRKAQMCDFDMGGHGGSPGEGGGFGRRPRGF